MRNDWGNPNVDNRNQCEGSGLSSSGGPSQKIKWWELPSSLVIGGAIGTGIILLIRWVTPTIMTR